MVLQTDGSMLSEEVVGALLAEVALKKEVFEVVLKEVFRGEAPGLVLLVVKLVTCQHTAPREVPRLRLEAVLWLDLDQSFPS
jgi:hypothetical protein